jgi:PIN domain nuclease of toxin-antitoxin system
MSLWTTLKNTCNGFINRYSCVSLDKLEIKGGFNTVEDFLNNNDIEILPIDLSHTRKLLKLEHFHNDPFDRMIISQAIAEKMAVITKDRFFKEYNIKMIW